MTIRKWTAHSWWLTALLALGCGDRPGTWEKEFSSSGAVGLARYVAVVDGGMDRVVFLSSPGDLALRASYVPAGNDVRTIQASEDGTKLFLLSRGVQPRRNPDDEKPRFTMIDTTEDEPRITRQDELGQALSGLAVDETGEWAVIYDAGASADAYVTNPNELILVNLIDGSQAPKSKTLRSEGGRPQRLSFTRPLRMPDGGERRFLVVEREHDIALVDLFDLDRDDITVGSPENAMAREATPAEVVYFPGDDANNAQFAIRFSDEPSVGVLELHAPEAGNDEQVFSISYNLVDVGGTASSIEFVRTDAGVRLAAVVPATSSAQLVETVTSDTTQVDFDYAFSGLKLVTEDIANRPDASDMALLFSNQATAVGFWALGTTSGQPYRSLDTQDIGVPVGQIYDVPGENYAHFKILKSGTSFFVLDLDERRSSPMLALSSLEIKVALDGARLWAYQPGGTQFARVTFDDLHPISLSTERSISGVFDIERASGGRMVVALHSGEGNGLGATVFDALAPDTAHSRFYSGFELGGLEQ